MSSRANKVVYLDNQATTACDPRVLEAMLPYFSEHYGNASSASHSFGWQAEAAVLNAREQIATAIGAHANELVFCSGATEANNLAIGGIVGSFSAPGHLLCTNTEHASVLDPMQYWQTRGWEHSLVEVGSDGLVEGNHLKAALRQDTKLLSIMAVNNEVGVLQDVAALAAIARQVVPDVVVHCDAVQALGKVPIDVKALGVDLLSLSAHKAYGPKGIGVLWRRRRPRLPLVALLHGGGQEGGLRPGTLAVPLIVGFGHAACLAAEELEAESRRIDALRSTLYRGLLSLVPDAQLNGSQKNRVAGNLNVYLPGTQSDELILAARGIAISSGSACASGSGRPSHVLAALYPDDATRSRQSIRIGIGRFTSEEDVQICLQVIEEALNDLKNE